MKVEANVIDGVLHVKIPIENLEGKILTGNDLKAYRYKRGWSQTDLAKKLGVTLRTVITYEQQETLNPRIYGFINSIL